jgi:DNA transformation protein
MATKASTIDYLLDQLSSIDSVRSRKMFGEYALYCGEKVVALVCDDQLFVKPTEQGKGLLDKVALVPPYPGAKPYLLVNAEQWEDRTWLSRLFVVTAAALPLPKTKKK